ncbi:MAG: hypothetical protein M1828_005222 [Chrysothrix sp. TS-e1954]|nr:MAG: hypothetical protein M1828_005222 [Chrysothrix sp. TS-e1954]
MAIDPAGRTPSDASLVPFMVSDFSPVDHLNSVLPALVLGNAQTSSTHMTPLTEVTSQCNSQISKISTQLTRLSTTLTRLTDDILRSGSRLAYEVEILRGATTSLNEKLTEGLADDLARFKPMSLDYERSPNGYQPSQDVARDRKQTLEIMSKLRTLVQVRSRLDEVVKVFGKALEWPAPPPEQQKSNSITSSLISVSAPEQTDLGVTGDQEHAQRLRREVAEMLQSDKEGVESAKKRIEELRDLTTVWRGTSQAKARVRLVESLQKLANDYQ